MNKDWAEKNKRIQELLKKATFFSAIDELIEFRSELMDYMYDIKKTLVRSDFNAIPFINHKGYENKTIAYSLYHTFRIEDIVSSTLIKKKDEVFFSGDYEKRMNSPIITTGNELVKEEIAEFSSKLNLDELYNYMYNVYEETNDLLKKLSFKDLKINMTEEDKNAVRKLKVVSEDENASWLIDYWGGKNIKGLIQMPFSRHWIMHIEAVTRIIDKIKK